MDDWQDKIEELLGEDTDRCARNAERWRVHLLECLALPLRVTGNEDFPWEEPYVFGGWSKRKYAELKKTRPSYTDILDLIDIEDPDDHDDLTARVKRVKDQKIFHIGLSWLTTKRKPDVPAIQA